MRRQLLPIPLAFALATTELTWMSAAHADEPSTPDVDAELAYRVPPGKGCPDETSFRNRVGARLGTDPFTTTSTRRIRVVVEPRGDVLVGVAELSDGASAPRSREIPSTEGCESLASALAATVALVLDPTGAWQRRAAARASDDTPQSSPPRTTPAARELPVAATTPAETERPARTEQKRRPAANAPHVVPLVTTGGAAGVGVAPGATFGAELGVGLARGSLSAVVLGRFDATPSATTIAPAGPLEVALYGAGLAGCGQLRIFRLCGVVRGGVSHARATATSQPSTTGANFLLVSVRPGIVLPIVSTLAVYADAELAALVARAELVFDGRSIWTAPPAAVFAGVGLLFSFGDGT